MKFNESNEDFHSKNFLCYHTIDSKIESILGELSKHEDSRVRGISKSILSNFKFDSVAHRIETKRFFKKMHFKEMKIGRLINNYHPTTEFPEGSIEMFVAAFAALNGGTSVIKVKE